MFTIPDEIMKHKNISPVSKLAYSILLKAMKETDTNSCRISYETLGDMLGVNRLTAKAALEGLHAVSLIDRQKDERRRLVYTLKYHTGEFLI
jgi:predicted transcriptional regulator